VLINGFHVAAASVICLPSWIVSRFKGTVSPKVTSLRMLAQADQRLTPGNRSWRYILRGCAYNSVHRCDATYLDGELKNTQGSVSCKLFLICFVCSHHGSFITPCRQPIHCTGSLQTTRLHAIDVGSTLSLQALGLLLLLLNAPQTSINSNAPQT
jgi:hypothetical protein